MSNLFEVIRDRNIPEDNAIREVIEVNPESRYVIIVGDDVSTDFMLEFRDRFGKFLDSDDRFFIIRGNVKFVKVNE